MKPSPPVTRMLLMFGSASNRVVPVCNSRLCLAMSALLLLVPVAIFRLSLMQKNLTLGIKNT